MFMEHFNSSLSLPTTVHFLPQLVFFNCLSWEKFSFNLPVIRETLRNMKGLSSAAFLFHPCSVPPGSKKFWKALQISEREREALRKRTNNFYLILWNFRTLKNVEAAFYLAHKSYHVRAIPVQHQAAFVRGTKNSPRPPTCAPPLQKLGFLTNLRYTRNDLIPTAFPFCSAKNLPWGWFFKHSSLVSHHVSAQMRG